MIYYAQIDKGFEMVQVSGTWITKIRMLEKLYKGNKDDEKNSPQKIISHYKYWNKIIVIK